jgi:hypothetical protein
MGRIIWFIIALILGIWLLGALFSLAGRLINVLLLLALVLVALYFATRTRTR